MPKKKKKKIKVMVAHDNRISGHTTKAHKFSKRLDKNPEYDTIHDQKKWKKGEKTSEYETNKREKEMVQESDVIVRVVPPASKTGEKRHEGAQKEVRKAMKQQKPVIELFENGARNSPNRSIPEKNYMKKVEVHLKRGETLDYGFKRGIEKLKKKGIDIDKNEKSTLKKPSPQKKATSRKPKKFSSKKSSSKKPSSQKKATSRKPKKSSSKKPSSQKKGTSRKPKKSSSKKLSSQKKATSRKPKKSSSKKTSSRKRISKKK